MKETIYTIPVLDGFTQGGPCAFCNMARKLETEAVDYALGPAYMEDDIRMETNRLGFCRRHYEEMYGKENKLGLALLAHTHLQQLNRDLDRLLQEGPTAKPLFGGKKTPDSVEKAAAYLEEVDRSCFICRKVAQTFTRYVDTFFYMWQQGGIQGEVARADGFCLPHFALLLRTGRQKLNPKAYGDFTAALAPLQRKALQTLEADLDWFIKKFDYRNSSEPWKNSKDAVPRALLKIASAAVEQQ
jgi:hypothetical protein